VTFNPLLPLGVIAILSSIRQTAGIWRQG